MRAEVKKSIVTNIFSVKLYSQEEIEELQRRHQEELEMQLEAHKRAQEEAEKKASLEEQKTQQQEGPVRRSMNKVGRNDPCPCGSGKKFKHCHG